jgi:Ca2+-binding RTX toxin-like protein
MVRVSEGNGDFSQEVTWDGGSGQDTLNVSFDGEMGDVPSLTTTVLPGFETCNYTAGEIDLVINGDDSNNIITATAQNVTVYGNGGDDQITVNNNAYTQNVASMGHILIDGGDGNDVLHGDATQSATLIGGVGDDTLVGGAGNDSLEGDDGDDHCDGGLGVNMIDGGAGNNVLDYSSEAGGTFNLTNMSDPIVVTNGDGTAKDSVVGGSFDSMITTPFADTVHCQFADDSGSAFSVYLGGGDDTFATQSEGAIGLVDGGAGNDTIYFNYDSPILKVLGNTGDDTIYDDAGYEGQYTIDGGPGYDIDNVNPDMPVMGLATAEFTVPAGIEQYSVGTDNNLLVYGNELDNVIYANAANVTVYGMGGDDQITAKAYSPEDTTAGHLLIDGGDGNDVLHGTASQDSTIIGGAGNDSLTGDGNFGSGYEPATPNFLMEGGDGNDHLYGGPGNDTLEGQAGNDVIYANDGNKDTIDGGDGFDHARWDNSGDVIDQVSNIESTV